MKAFHICTISHNLSQYQQMKASFLEAGFDENRCRYTLFDNSQGNIHEPYSTFNLIKAETAEPYIIFCHHDILLDQGYGITQLVNVIKEIEELNPEWAILGNAGYTGNYELVARINDHITPQWAKSFPQKVHSLDENFLVIKSSARVCCSSSELQGFHFYATDLCLNAISEGQSCYVVDFYLTHLSAGNYDKNFYIMKKIAQKAWGRKFEFLYIQTLTCTVCLSKYRLIRYLFNRHKIASILSSNPAILRWLTGRTLRTLIS